MEDIRGVQHGRRDRKPGYLGSWIDFLLSLERSDEIATERIVKKGILPQDSSAEILNRTHSRDQYILNIMRLLCFVIDPNKQTTSGQVANFLRIGLDELYESTPHI